jgi:hypothetical protein
MNPIGLSAPVKRVSRGLVFAIAVCAIVCAQGCVETTITGDNPPPWAAISDNARDPSSMPKPPPDPDEPGVIGKTADAIGTVVMFPFHLVGSAFSSSNNPNPPPPPFEP